jgi:peptidoglycan/xylan/chitin deacetylase (PgdA/CDA1 family)
MENIQNSSRDKIRHQAKILQDLQKIPILVYHKINSHIEVGINSIIPVKFIAQIKQLYENGYTTVTMKDLLSEVPLPPKPFIITFDDGYESVYLNAFEILDQCNYRAVVFIISEFLGKLNTWDATIGWQKSRHLSVEQVNLLVQSGWEVGSHSKTHRSLKKLSKNALYKELKESKEKIECFTGKDVYSMAYPFGFYNEEVKSIASESGYYFGFRNLSLFPEIADLFAIQRIPIYSLDSKKSIVRKMKLFKFSFMERFFTKILGLPAHLTPYYQLLFRSHLFLDM